MTDDPVACGQELEFALVAQCGGPPYYWSLIDGGFPRGVLFEPDDPPSFYGVISTCDSTIAELEVTDGAGEHAIVAVVFQ